MVGKCRKCTNFRRGCKHIPPMNHFFISYPFNLEDNRGFSCSLVSNQDFQDFEDFLVLGVGWEGACYSMQFKKISAFLFAAAMIAAAKCKI